jgi:hypothetical protein
MRAQRLRTGAVATLLMLPALLVLAGPADAAGPRVVEIDARTLQGGPQFVVTGTVTQDGTPVPGASVHLMRSASYQFIGAPPEDLGTVTSGPDGRFSSTAAGLASDVVTYRAELPSDSGSIEDTTDRVLWIERVPVTISIDELPEQIVAGVPFHATVHVSDADGPLSGMPVSLEVPQIEGSFELIPGPQTGVTDEQGNADVTGLALKGRADDVRDAVWAFANGTLTHDTDVDGVSRHVEYYPTQIGLDAPASLTIDEPAQVTGSVDCPLVGGEQVLLEAGGVTIGSAVPDSAGSFSTTITAQKHGTELTTRLASSKSCSAGTRTDPVDIVRLATQITVEDLPASVPLWQRFSVAGEIVATRYDFAGSFERVGLYVDDALVDFQDRPGPFELHYQPQGAVGQSHMVELRYSGNPRWSPASKAWTVTTGKAEPAVVLRAPSTVYAPGEVLLRGDVAGAPPGMKMTITSPTGVAVPVTVADVGQGYAHFSAWSPVPAGLVGSSGQWVAEVTPEDGRISATEDSVEVPVATPPLTAQLDRATYVPGDTADLAVTPHQPLDGSLTIALGVRGETTSVASTWSSPDSAFLARIPVRENATLVIDSSQQIPFDGPAVRVRVERALRVTLPLRTKALAPRARVGTYAVYDRTANPMLRTYDRVTPAWQAKCLQSQVQRLTTTGAWRSVVSRLCDREDSLGRITFRYTGWRISGSRFRVRSLYTADARWERSPSAWAYFRFR